MLPQNIIFLINAIILVKWENTIMEVMFILKYFSDIKILFQCIFCTAILKYWQKLTYLLIINYDLASSSQPDI